MTDKDLMTFKKLDISFSPEDIEKVYELRDRAQLLGVSCSVNGCIEINESGEIKIYLDTWIKIAKAKNLEKLIIPDFVNFISLDFGVVNYDKPIIFPRDLKVLADRWDGKKEKISMNFLTKHTYDILDFSKCKNIKCLFMKSFINVNANQIILPETCNIFEILSISECKIKKLVINGEIKHMEKSAFFKLDLDEIEVKEGFRTVFNYSYYYIRDMKINKKCIIHYPIALTIDNLYFSISKEYCYSLTKKYLKEQNMDILDFEKLLLNICKHPEKYSYFYTYFTNKDEFFYYYINYIYLYKTNKEFSIYMKEIFDKLLIDAFGKVKNIYLYNDDISESINNRTYKKLDFKDKYDIYLDETL